MQSTQTPPEPQSTPIEFADHTAPQHRLSKWRMILLTLCLIIALPFLSVIALRWFQPPLTSLMLARKIAGETITIQHVPWGQISPHIIASVILAEDARFCQHHGIDWVEMRKAFANKAGVSRGASTVTMQLVKNIYLWEGRSYLRKAVELPLALWMETVLSKQRILEIYLNNVEWGQGIFGIEAAAQAYYHKPASQLTKREAARLAILLPNPRLRHLRHLSPVLRQASLRLEKQITKSATLTKCLN